MPAAAMTAVDQKAPLMPNFEITGPDGTKLTKSPLRWCDRGRMRWRGSRLSMSTQRRSPKRSRRNPNYYTSGDRFTAGEVRSLRQGPVRSCACPPQPALDAINWIRQNVTGAKEATFPPNPWTPG